MCTVIQAWSQACRQEHRPSALQLETQFSRAVSEPCPKSPARPEWNFFGAWKFLGDMKVLQDGTRCLANSSVAVGMADINAAKHARCVVKHVRKDAGQCSVAMIRKESEILAKLSNHPHILQSLHSEDLPSELVLITPFAPQGDLSKLIPARCCIEELEARKLCMQILSGLAYLHQQRIIHGDVKPENIFLTYQRAAYIAKLSDFGLSIQVPEGHTFVTLGQVQGSYGFIPAEVIEQREASYAVDVFALGVILFRMLASYDPFYPASNVREKLQWDQDAWMGISSLAASFTEQMLSPEPNARGSAGDLLGGAHAWLWASPKVNRTPPRKRSSPQPLQNVHFHCLEQARLLWEGDSSEGCGSNRQHSI